MKPFASRMSRISPSMTVAIDNKAKELKAAGKDVVGLGAGEPDFDTPDYAKEAGIESIRKGLTKYTPPAGILSVKEAVCRKFKNENGLDYKPSQIVITSGAKHAITNVLMALIEEGDEVIIPAPYWVSYTELVKLFGGTPIIVEAPLENGFKMTAEQFEAAITPRTKMLILNSPSNPTGAVYDEDELKAFADIIVKHDIYCMSDEIYEHIIYGDTKHVSIASFNKDIYDRTIVINGVSKSYAMTGWRIGYIGTSEGIAKAISTAQSQATHHPANASQIAAAAALDGGLGFVNTMKVEFNKRRNFMVESLSAIPGVQIPAPNGAFYAFADVSPYIGKSFNGKKINNSIELCEYLLDEQLLAIVPGAAFGAEGCVRMSYATSMEILQEAIKRFKAGLEALV